MQINEHKPKSTTCSGGPIEAHFFVCLLSYRLISRNNSVQRNIFGGAGGLRSERSGQRSTRCQSNFFMGPRVRHFLTISEYSSVLSG
jgi:hypothetical protein